MARLLFALAALAMSVPAHAAWLHGCPADAPTHWSADDQADKPGCANVALAPGADVETLYPLPAGENPETTILLHGGVRDGRFAIGEYELPAAHPAPAPPAPMPLRADLLALLRVRTFGVEERVQVKQAEGGLHVECRAGARPAGVILGGPWYLPRANVLLAARYAADGVFVWQAADAAHADRGDAIALGSLAPGSTDARLALPPSLDRAGWRQFVLLCPATAARLDLQALTLEPAAPPRPAPRATWVWHAADWMNGGPALLDWAAAHGMRDLFVTVPLDAGSKVSTHVAQPDRLAAFVRAAGARGIGVHSVDGDPRMVLPAEIPATVERLRAYVAYNAAQAPDARLRGVQFDVEPYLLPDDVLPATERDARYLDLARALKAAAGPLRLEFVVPFWWGRNRTLLDAMAPYADALAVMDYRTDRAQVYAFAGPFLDWAARHGKQARIVLEAGPIDPVTQRRYVRAPSGTLQVLDAGGRRVLALLRAPVMQDGARLYRLQSTREIDGSATTFKTDKAALQDLLPGLEADFGTWDSFGGIAVHELR